MRASTFYELADYATSLLVGGEVFTATLAGEKSDFCRLNDGKVRQAGTVEQASLAFRLISGQKNAKGGLALSGVQSEDRERLRWLVGTLREQLTELPDDPYLLYATEVHSSERIDLDRLPDSRATIDEVIAASAGTDLVGIYAAGAILRGFANSFGQRNWYETHSFNLDWSCYLRADKAVKTGYAGFTWDSAVFQGKVESARKQLQVLKKTPRTIPPGKYRVYLAPNALNEVTDTLAWGGFGLKSHKTKQTPLIKMIESGQRMNAAVTLRENTADGLAPDFNESGFVKPAAVTLIEGGEYRDCLVSPRSAKEYGVPTNAAADSEMPQSLELGAGDIALDSVEEKLGEGVYVNNLWYLNYSDRSACRITGMTRFASFWVENGQIVSPLEVMRFDESVLRLLGDKLVGFTRERELILSASTYGQRAATSSLLPGALVDDFSFTL